ncbi:hypothetical protein RchiOBHm_Chr6g0268581 [Rosa chinensis]|uniref:Uncharacterized protein n=1 Tax=Rosa chinensis TaxID=74649 RepID=A0A2P6PQ98_ROSCH|nr:hypothetical protein RchiOBHm_Chr6g0268581 [Rosa chinensis]
MSIGLFYRDDFRWRVSARRGMFRPGTGLLVKVVLLCSPRSHCQGQLEKRFAVFAGDDRVQSFLVEKTRIKWVAQIGFAWFGLLFLFLSAFGRSSGAFSGLGLLGF